MTPIDFVESDTVVRMSCGNNPQWTKDQPEYQPLPVAIWGDERVSCWKLTCKERVSLLLFGRLWLRQLTFGDPLQPQLPQVENPFYDQESSDRR